MCVTFWVSGDTAFEARVSVCGQIAGNLCCSPGGFIHTRSVAGGIEFHFFCIPLVSVCGHCLYLPIGQTAFFEVFPVDVFKPVLSVLSKEVGDGSVKGILRNSGFHLSAISGIFFNAPE